jgi:uncharacterized protein (TIGR02996 family)
MNNDEAFLRAIADNPADDTLRLAYTNWLDDRSDSRADLLRVQQTFAQESLGSSRYRDLCEQEQQLVRQLDPAWFQCVRRCTTAKPCRDLALLVPELRPFARATTRLHPHRAAGPLPLWMSKIGGRFLWPATEPWPACAECGVDLTPVLQLRSRDVPDLTFPSGTNIFQLFWCPDESAHGYQPAPRIWWRDAGAVTSIRTDDPDLRGFPRTSDWEGYVPLECVVYPERVLEYPVGDDLYALAGAEQAARIGLLVENMDIGSEDDLMERFDSIYGPSDPQSLAFYELGQCPGSKVGGRPGFQQNGQLFDHLLTLSTWEFDSASFRRWLAVEDQRLLAPPGEPLTWTGLFRESSRFQPLQQAVGMQLGRTQRAHVYVCREREPWEVVSYVND